MGRAILVTLGLGFAGLILVLFCGPPGEHYPGRVGDRAVSGLATPAARAPAALPGEAAAGPAPQGACPQPGVQPANPGAAWPASARDGNGRSPRIPPRVASLVKRHHLEVVIKKYARRYGVDEDLVWAVIRQESGFNPEAVSPKGAMGLMQLMPGTAAQLGVSDAFDVEQNIAGGIKYLDCCLNQFHRNVPLALAAYNAGPENVVKYQGCPPFPETRQYVISILRAYAGASMQEDLKQISLSPVSDADLAEPAGLKGLPWRIPLPKWIIATPRCTLGAPQWKVALRPF